MRYAIILLVPLLALLAACGGDGAEPVASPTPSPAVARPSPTPEVTPTPTAAPTPSPTAAPTPAIGSYDDRYSFRSFGVKLAEAIATADAGFFLDNVKLQELNCDEFVSPPSCAGQPSGGRSPGDHGRGVEVRGVWA